MISEVLLEGAFIEDDTSAYPNRRDPVRSAPPAVLDGPRRDAEEGGGFWHSEPSPCHDAARRGVVGSPVVAVADASLSWHTRSDWPRVDRASRSSAA